MDIVKLATKSIFYFFDLAFAGKLHLKISRLWQNYKVSDGKTYAIFRETVSDQQFDGKEVTLVVGFRLFIIESDTFFHWLFQRLCILTTPFWSGFKGFQVKLWMVDPQTKDYLGIYKWIGRDNAKVYAEALEKVLKKVSTTGSIWYEIVDEDFEKYLKSHKVKQ